MRRGGASAPVASRQKKPSQVSNASMKGIRGGKMTIISTICGLERIVLIPGLNPSSNVNDWIWVFNRSPSEVTKQRFQIPYYTRRHLMVMRWRYVGVTAIQGWGRSQPWMSSKVLKVKGSPPFEVARRRFIQYSVRCWKIPLSSVKRADISHVGCIMALVDSNNKAKCWVWVTIKSRRGI